MADTEPEADGADEYERRYMDGTRSLARSKQRMPTWFFALMGLSFLLSAGASIATGSLAGLLSVIPIAFVTLLFSHLRLVVTEKNLHVQYGLFGPTIPLARIVKITAEKYDWKEYGGWGLRYGRNGVLAYSTPGHGDLCVRILWNDENGKEKAVVVTCDDPNAIVRAVQQATGAQSNTGVRVENAPAPATIDSVENERKETTAEIDTSRVRPRKSA